MLFAVGGASVSHAVERVKTVNLNILNPAPIITLENKSNNKHISKLDVKPTSSSMNIKVDGLITCKKNHTAYMSFIYYGLVSIVQDNVNVSLTLHGDEVAVSNGEHGGIIENAPATHFNVPLNKIKNGHPSVKLDPVAYLESKANQYVNGGGKEIDFYKQDHTYTVQVPISLLGGCWKNSNYSKKQQKQSLKLAPVKIKYIGDKSLNDGPAVNVQLGQLGQNPTINNNQPLILNKADFQNNIPHYIGKCIPDQNPTIRVNYRGAGKGKIRFKIGDAPNFVVHNSNEISYDSSNQLNRHFDFEYPLIAKMNQYQFKEWKTINKTFGHQLTVRAQVKNDGSDTWGDWKDFDNVTFNHRCTPVVVAPIGSNGKDSINYQNGNEARGTAQSKKNKVMLKPKPQVKPERQSTTTTKPTRAGTTTLKKCASNTECTTRQ